MGSGPPSIVAMRESGTRFFKIEKILVEKWFPDTSLQGFGHKGNETTGLETSQDVSERMRIGVGHYEHYVCGCMYTHMPACKHRPRQRD